MEPGLDRADGSSQGHGDIGERKPDVIVEDDDRSIAIVEPSQDLADEFAIGQGGVRIGRGGPFHKGDLHFYWTPAPATRLVEAGVDGQPVQPGLEAVRVAQAADVAPRPDETILDSVLGELGVAQDEAGGRVQLHEQPFDERGEGIMVARLCPFDECALVHVDPRLGAIGSIVRYTVWRRRKRNGSRGRWPKNRIDPSFVWMDAMQDFTARLTSRTWERLLGDPTSTMTEEHFLRLAGSELDRVYRLAGFLLGDAHEAEDATQEALIRAWRSIGSLRDPGGFLPWFDRIVVNLCRDRLRRRRRIRFIPLDGTADLVQVADPFGAILDRDEVLGRLNMLGADERIVVVLHYWADLTLVAVAERLGWPIGTVKSRLHRALETMAGSPGGRGPRR